MVLTSDNGAGPTEGMNGHECNGQWHGTKRMSYEGGHRVPLIIRWPGVVEPGTTRDETVCLTDLSSTFADLLGRKYPGEINNLAEDHPNRVKTLLAELNRIRDSVRSAPESEMPGH